MLGDSQRHAAKPVGSHCKESGCPFPQGPDRSQQPPAPSLPVQPGHRKRCSNGSKRPVDSVALFYSTLLYPGKISER